MDQNMAPGSSLGGTSLWTWVTAEESWLSMAPVFTSLGHQFGHREWPRFWASTGPSVVTEATNIDTDSGYSRTTDPDMDLGNSHGPDLIVALVDIEDCPYSNGPSSGMAPNAKMSLGGSPDPGDPQGQLCVALSS